MGWGKTGERTKQKFETNGSERRRTGDINSNPGWSFGAGWKQIAKTTTRPLMNLLPATSFRAPWMTQQWKAVATQTANNGHSPFMTLNGVNGWIGGCELAAQCWPIISVFIKTLLARQQKKWPVHGLDSFPSFFLEGKVEQVITARARKETAKWLLLLITKTSGALCRHSPWLTQPVMSWWPSKQTKPFLLLCLPFSCSRVCSLSRQSLGRTKSFSH